MGKKILIVEDEILIGMMLAQTIAEVGYQVCEVVTTGEEALKAVQAEQPDAVLMDISLNGIMDGIDAAKRIKEKQDVPIIFFTGYQDKSLVERAMKTNPFAILDKMGPMDDILATLERVFA